MEANGNYIEDTIEETRPSNATFSMDSNGIEGIDDMEFDDAALLPDLTFSLVDVDNLVDEVMPEVNVNKHLNETNGIEINGNITEEPDLNGNTEEDSGKKEKDWEAKVNEIGEPLEIMEELAELLNTKLSRDSLYCGYKLLQAGADYRIVADVVKGWRKKNEGKPRRRLGHYFEPTEENKQPKKKEWVW